jgi:hypothetical protein
MSNHLDHDEETIGEKAKRGAGVFTLIGSGLLSILHVLSHIVPALAVLGLSLGGRYQPLYNLINNEYMQFAFIPFVVLSFYYMYRDHRHHKHERDLRKQLSEAQEELKKFKKRK